MATRIQTIRRQISDAEWLEPTWYASTFHHADFGVELTTDDGEVWGITWDLPGPSGESLRLQPGRVVERGAVWDVTTREPWRSSIEWPITDVALRYHRWSPEAGGFWCTRASISFGHTCIEVLLGDRDAAGSLGLSADSIAVLLEPDQLPAWERTNDLV